MRGVIYILSIVLLQACHQKQPLDQNMLVRFIEDEGNGLKKTIDEEGFSVSMMYKPVDFIAKQQMQKGTRREYDSLIRYFSDYLYFTLAITRDGKDLETSFGLDPGSFADNISYLSADFGQAIKLLTKKDTADILDYAYSRSYGIGSSNFLLVFKKPRDEKFEIEVKGYHLGFGTINFSFDQTDIEKTPKLKLNLL